MIRYVEANSARCEIAPEIAGQLRAGHQHTEAAQKKLCVMANLASSELSLSDVLGQPPQRGGINLKGWYWLLFSLRLSHCDTFLFLTGSVWDVSHIAHSGNASQPEVLVRYHRNIWAVTGD